jgi:Protein kinase G rubredoxin domain
VAKRNPARPPAQRAGLVRPEPWWGLDLVTADALETTSKAATEAKTEATPGAAAESTDPDMTVPENARFCGSCGRPVGRGRDSRSGRVKGFCPACSKPFDFTRSRSGEIIADRYGADAWFDGRGADADDELDRAIALATELGDDFRLRLLDSVAIRRPDSKARLRPDVTRGDMLRLGMDSTKTGVAPAHVASRPPASVRTCHECGGPTYGADLKCCENCGAPFDGKATS